MTATPITGRHVAVIFGSAFAVIIAVNLTLASQAIRTFPGLEVRNSYVASQSFDRDRAAQQALGWSVRSEASGGRLTLWIDDAQGPVEARIDAATLGRATHVGQDQSPEFRFDGRAFVADITPLDSGNWNLRLKATAPDGTAFQQRIILRVTP